MIKFLDIQKITSGFEPELSEAITRVLKRGWFLLGEETASFENEYASYLGSKHCIGTANGLDALRLILKAYMDLGFMKEGDEVIVPANTFIATILAITDNRLKPVFIEPDISTYNLDSKLIENAITERTRALVVVHLYGLACWPKELREIADRYGLRIIEDNAQAAGAMVSETALMPTGSWGMKIRRTGSLGDAAGHSFYPGKNLGALGDGGAVTTDDDDLAAVIRSLANYGSSEKYIHDYRGLNSRLDEIQAAVLRVKLPRLDEDNRHRRDLARYYFENINNPRIILPGRSCISLAEGDATDLKDIQYSEELAHVWHLFVIRNSERDQLRAYLSENNIQTLIHYPVPPHRQSAYSEYSSLSLPVTEMIHRQVLSLPISQVMTENEAEQVVEAINNYGG